MILRCPGCGAESSLELLINAEDGARIVNALASFGAAANHVVRYLALFRPEKRRLSFSRVASLLDEITPSIKNRLIERDGKTHDAPMAAWIAGFEKTMQARDEGKLRLPLKSHGYLFEIVIAEAARAGGVRDVVPASGVATARAASATGKALDVLEQRKRRDA